MSKTKLAVTIFCVAFAANIVAFILFKSNWIIEENKMVWLYELPLSASPLDSGVATDFGPSQAIQGTLIRPGSGDSGVGLELELAKTWTWDHVNHSLTFQLNPLLHYQDGTAITASDFVKAADYIKKEMKPFLPTLATLEWRVWFDSLYRAVDAQTLEVKFKAPLPQGMTPEALLNKVFSNAFTGTIHPKNLDALERGEVITKEWISSGPYRVRKWNPKEVILVSREDFPLGMESGFFRILKYQSAPVINPSADYLQSAAMEKEISQEHSLQNRDLELHVFWICRSWREAGSVCADKNSRSALNLALSPRANPVPTLAGKTVRYRIPVGSEPFRAGMVTQIHDQVTRAGGTAKEVSFFFKNSNDADLELQFISVPKNAGRGFAEMLSRLSGRLSHASAEPFLAGEVTVFPQAFQWKGPRAKGPFEIFKNVFLVPDMSDKKMPI